MEKRAEPVGKTSPCFAVFFMLVVVGLVLFPGCCRRTPSAGENSGSGLPASGDPDRRPAAVSGSGSDSSGSVDRFGVDIPSRAAGKNVPGSQWSSAQFDRHYKKGVQLLEEAKYGEAIAIFEQIETEFPNSVEASIAAYCIAEIHFRNKANQQALEAFKEIVEKYPNTQAAENAQAGITYLESFEKHEAEYVSPEIEDRRRRGF